MNAEIAKVMDSFSKVKAEKPVKQEDTIKFKETLKEKVDSRESKKPKQKLEEKETPKIKDREKETDKEVEVDEDLNLGYLNLPAFKNLQEMDPDKKVNLLDPEVKVELEEIARVENLGQQVEEALVSIEKTEEPMVELDKMLILDEEVVLEDKKLDKNLETFSLKGEEVKKEIENVDLKVEKKVEPVEDTTRPLEVKALEEDLIKLEKPPIELEEGLVIEEFEEFPKDSKIDFNLPNRKLENTNTFVEEVALPEKLPEENIEKVYESLFDMVETTKVGEKTSMKLRLSPEELGNVEIVLDFEDSKLKVKLLVENEMTKKLFNNEFEKISENLLKQNLKVEDFDIDLRQDFNLNKGSSQQGSEERQNPFLKKNFKSKSGFVARDLIGNQPNQRNSGLNILA